MAASRAVLSFLFAGAAAATSATCEAGDEACLAAELVEDGDAPALLQHRGVEIHAALDEAKESGLFRKTWGHGEPDATTYVMEFTPYYTYTGDLKVSGWASVTGSGLLETATQTLSWKLSGLDTRCKRVPKDVPNACGVHIHEGSSCYDNALGHYWNKELIDDDPWSSVTYTAKWRGNSFVRNVAVVTGLTNYDVLGHTVIVHDYTGARIACGIIEPEKLAVPAFTPYFSYEGDLAVSGEMLVTPFGILGGAGQSLSWILYGLDPQCDNGADAETANSCGVHIHAGMNCSSDAFGHYWNKTTFSEDPWSPVGYNSHTFFGHTFDFKAKKKVTTGLESTDVMGHTMIVHNYAGGRIACGIIAPYTLVANAYVPYYTYQGDLKVGGWVSAEGKGVTTTAMQVLSWELEGVDPACATAPEQGANANACGIHIHAGTSCTDDALGHYYSAEYLTADPWTAVKYTTLPGGTTTGKMVPVVTGLSNYDTLGHTMIVHDMAGGRIACGILSTALSR